MSHQLSDKEIWVYGLLVACPEGNPLPSCPLERYRSFSDKEKLKILKNFTDEEVDEIIRHHNQCLFRKV